MSALGVRAERRRAWRRRGAVAAGAAIALVLLVAPSTTLTQEPPQEPPQEPDSAGNAFSDRWAPHGLQAALYALLIAPSGLIPMGLRSSAPGDTVVYWRERARFSVTIGQTSASEGPKGDVEGAWLARDMELLVRRWYVDARVQHHSLSERVRLTSGRIGHFTLATAGFAGGVTLGYRDGPEDVARRGPEIGFPIVWGNARRWGRWDVHYVFGSQVSWNYRLRGAWALSTTPLYAGIDVEGSETLRKQRLSTLGAGFLVGMRY